MQEFKVGDKVSIEGILSDNKDNYYPLELTFEHLASSLSFTKDGKLHLKDKEPVLKLIERPRTSKYVEISDVDFESIIEDYKQDFQHRDVTSLIQRLKEQLFGDQK